MAIPFCPSELQSSLFPLKRVITTASQQDGFAEAPRPRLSALSLDGRYAAFLSEDMLVMISAFDPMGYRFEANVPNCDVSVLSFSQDAATLYVATLNNGRVHLDTFDVTLATKVEPSRVFDPIVGEKGPTELVSFEISPHRMYTLFSVVFQPVEETQSPETWLFAYDKLQLLWKMRLSSECYRFLDDNGLILQFDDKKVHLVDSLTGESKVVLTEQENHITAIGVLNTSVVIGAETSLSVLKDGFSQPLTKPPLRASVSIAIARFSADSRFFAIGTNNGGIQLWKWVSSEWIGVASFFVHFSGVQDFAFHPNGKHLVCILYDGTIRISDISAIIEDHEWKIEVEEGVLAEGSWFSQHVPLGGWFWGGTKPEPFLFQYPFALPPDVATLNWEIDPRNPRTPEMKELDLERSSGFP